MTSRESLGLSTPREVGDVADMAFWDHEMFVQANVCTAKAALQAKSGLCSHPDYGTCRDCGGKISAQRLKAIPGAICCCFCEEKRERTVHLKVPHDSYFFLRV